MVKEMAIKQVRETMGSAPDRQPDAVEALELDQPSERYTGLRRWLVVFLLVALALTVLGIIRRTDQSNETQFQTKNVRRGDIVLTVTATGTLAPTKKVDVVSELSGIIKTVEADYNDHVKSGQVLARLDTSKLELVVAQYTAALEKAKANTQLAKAKLKDAVRDYQRQRALRPEGAAAQSKLDEKETAFEKASAEVIGAKAEVIRWQAVLDAAHTELSKAFIRSPIDGIVLARSVEPGQNVSAILQMPALFTVAESLTCLEMRVDVGEADVTRVKEGQTVVLTVDALPDRTFHGHVVQTRYCAKTMGGVATYKTVLRVDNSDLSLRPGMTATACITVGRIEDAILVPNAALRFTPPVPHDKRFFRALSGMLLPHPSVAESAPRRSQGNGRDGTHQVWVLHDNHPVPISITLGATDETWTEVVDGDLKPGMVLVVGVLENER